MDLVSRIESGGAKRIIVVGDLIHDVWFRGDVNGCQEGCLRIRQSQASVTTSGGAGNAAWQLSNWPSDHSPMNYCYHGELRCVYSRFLDANDHIVFRHDSGNFRLDTQALRERRLEIVARINASPAPDAVLISDYDKGFLDERTIGLIIDACNARDIPVVADVKRAPYVYRGALMKANDDYVQKWWPGGSFPGIHTRGPLPPLVGEHGVLEETTPVTCRNHVGAGDCFAAHLALGLAHGLSTVEACRLAYSAGRVFVQHLFSRPPWPHEIRKDLDPVGGKVLDGVSVTALRSSVSGRIVLTNGIYRIVHPGHVAMLAWAKRQGDVLVVGVNDDQSAARLRHDQVVLPLAERVAMLAAMEAVDWVAPFAEDTPHSLIKALSPNVLVKGPEYRGRPVPGDDLVSDVRFAPENEFSFVHATSTIAKIRGEGG